MPVVYKSRSVLLYAICFVHALCLLRVAAGNSCQLDGASSRSSTAQQTDVCTDNENWSLLQQQVGAPDADIQCHRFTFNSSSSSSKSRRGVVIGGLLPINTFNKEDYVCRSSSSEPRISLAIQLTEAFLLAVKLAWEKHTMLNPQLKDVLTGVEIRDSCLESQLTVSRVLEMVKSSREAEDLCADTANSRFVDVYQESIVSGGKSHNDESGCDGRDSKPAFSRRVPIVIGPGISGNVEVSAPTLSVFKLPHITYWATSALFEDKQQYPHLFRTVPSDRYQAQAMASVMKAYDWRYVYALASSDQVTGSQGLQFFREAVNDLGRDYCIAYEAQFHKDDTQNVKQIVNRIIAGRPTPASGTKLYNDPSVIMLFAGFEVAEALFEAFSNETESLGIKNESSFVWLASDGWITHAAKYLKKYDLVNHTVIGFSFNVPSKFVEQQKEFASTFSNHLQNLTLNKETVRRNPWLGVLWQNHRKCSAKFLNPKCADNPNVCCNETETASSVFGINTDNLSPPLDSGALWLAVEGAVKTLSTAVSSCGMTISADALGEILETAEVECGDSSRLCRIFTQSRDVEPGFTLKAAFFDRKTGEFESSTIGSWSEEREIEFNCSEGRTGDPCKNYIFPLGSIPSSVCAKPCDPGYFYEEATDLILGVCCWKCSVCPSSQHIVNDTKCVDCGHYKKPNHNRTVCLDKDVIGDGFSNPLGILVLILSTLGTLSVVFTCWAFSKCSGHAIVKESGGKQNNALFIALILAYSNAMFLMVPATTAYCIVSSITTSSIIILIMSLLVSRCFRLLWLGRNQYKPSRISLALARTFGQSLKRQLAFVAIVQVVLGVGTHSILQVASHQYRAEHNETENIIYECRGSDYFGPISISFINFTMVMLLVFVVITRGIIDLPNMLVRTSQSCPSMYDSGTIHRKVFVQEGKLLLLAGLTVCIILVSLNGTQVSPSPLFLVMTVALGLICESFGVWCCLYVPRLYVMRNAVMAELHSISAMASPGLSRASSQNGRPSRRANSSLQREGSANQSVNIDYMTDTPGPLSEYERVKRSQVNSVIMETSI